LPANTVKTRFHRAKRLLRQALGAEFAAALPDTFPFAGDRCDQFTARVLARLAVARELTVS
jgi:RNA polymerase sigma-70 factor (ECF subfamily)